MLFQRGLLAVVLGAAVASQAVSEESNAVGPAVSYPDRAVTLVVPYPPGGPNDTIARTVAPELASVLGVSVVIENKPGAAGNIGATAVARARPDGYTLALPGAAIAINTVIFDNTPYRLSDIRPVGMVAQGPIVAVAHPSLGVKTLDELLEQARTRPGEIAFPSGGRGTSPHLAGELLKIRAGVDLLHVPYKGTGEFMPDLLAGRVPLAFVSPLIVRQHVEAGTLIPLATTGQARLRGWESLPTVSETGVEDYEVSPWYAVVAPAQTPDAIIEKLNEALQQALRSESVQAKLVSLGLDALPGTADDAQRLIDQETTTWAAVPLAY